MASAQITQAWCEACKTVPSKKDAKFCEDCGNILNNAPISGKEEQYIRSLLKGEPKIQASQRTLNSQGEKIKNNEKYLNSLNVSINKQQKEINDINQSLTRAKTQADAAYSQVEQASRNLKMEEAVIDQKVENNSLIMDFPDLSDTKAVLTLDNHPFTKPNDLGPSKPLVHFDKAIDHFSKITEEQVKNFENDLSSVGYHPVHGGFAFRKGLMSDGGILVNYMAQCTQVSYYDPSYKQAAENVANIIRKEFHIQNVKIFFACVK